MSEMTTGEQAFLVFPDDFDNYAWEVESKGVFWDVRLLYRGEEYPLTFYEPQRLAQDVADTLAQDPFFFERNIVIITKVTREAMNRAAEELVRTNRVDGLAAVG
jgi:hypothetical protein